MIKKLSFETKQFPRTLILGIHAPYNRTLDVSSYFDEFMNLIDTNGTPYDVENFIKLRTVDQAYFLTKGKLIELKNLIEEHKIENLIISEALTPRQERNLTNYLDCSILDRTRLILEIFEKSAHSAEGKTQVAIAKLQYEKSRLTGKGIHLSQQTGVFGLRGGAGETLKEQELRQINQAMDKAKRQLKKMQQARDTQRKRRLNNKVPNICLIGYTNAGKSTILNTLTKSDVLAEDKLFATLDTTTRKLFINGKEKGVISDTVGFIQQLPTHLIEAFKSTLSELQYADLLLHVVDISDANWESHVKVVHKILDDLKIDKPLLYVFNKCDVIAHVNTTKQAFTQYQPYVMSDAISKEGLSLLIDFLDQWKPEEAVTETGSIIESAN